MHRRSLDPLWYETLRLQTWLPPLELAPELVVEVRLRHRRLFASRDIVRCRSLGPACSITSYCVAVTQVWSYGVLSDHQFVGTYRKSLRSVNITVRAPGEDPKPVPRPAWIKLSNIGTHEGGGEILASFELLPLDPKEQTALEAVAKAFDPNAVIRPIMKPVANAVKMGKDALMPEGTPPNESARRRQTAAAGELSGASVRAFAALEASRQSVAQIPPPMPVQVAQSRPDVGQNPLANAPPLLPSEEPLPLLEPPTKPLTLRMCIMGLRGLQLSGLKDPSAVTLLCSNRRNSCWFSMACSCMHKMHAEVLPSMSIPEAERRAFIS